MAAAKEKTVSVWGDKVHPKVKIVGSGDPLVYLHGGYGPIETELLDELGKSFTVYAPEHPGITAGDEDAYKALDDIWDLVLYYYEMFDKLELEAPAVVGHSFGGMVAAEIAANSPLAVQGTKAVLAANEGRTVAEGLDYVATWNAGMLASDDLTEAVTAFMEKRTPKFTGR